LAFAVRNRVPVACFHSHDARGFAFWSTPDEYVGKTGFYVIADEISEEATVREYSGFFTSMKLEAEFTMMRGGKPFRPVRVYRCEKQTRPYPFDFKGTK
jgi:hypothetical protein